MSMPAVQARSLFTQINQIAGEKRISDSESCSNETTESCSNETTAPIMIGVIAGVVVGVLVGGSGLIIALFIANNQR